MTHKGEVSLINQLSLPPLKVYPLLLCQTISE